jgi:diguanylate cyclase (GGDEF)-like protein
LGHGPGDAAHLDLAQVLEATAAPLLVYALDGTPLLMNAAARDLLGLEPGENARFGGSGFRLLEPDGVTPIRRDRHPFTLSASGQDVDAELVMESPDGRRRRLMTQCRGLRGADGSLQSVVITALDVTDLHDQHRLVSRQAAMVSVIGEASRAVLRENDARTAMCRAAADVSDALVATIMEPNGDDRLVATACYGAELVGLSVPLDETSMVSEAFLTGRTLTLANVADDPRVSRDLLAAWERLDRGPMVGAAWIPVMDRGRGVGLLSVAFDRVVDDWPDRIAALEILAGETAVALERQNLLRRLSTEAWTDGLTGAANRRAWDATIEQRMRHAERSVTPLAVVLLDLDHFKQFNDTHGHLAGDDVLRDAVAAWQQRLRPGDLLCRWGGEEFAVLLPGCTLRGAVRVATTLRTLVPRSQTASAGVAVWTGQESADDLMRRADAALYTAKAAGRNRVVSDTRR